MTSWVIDVLLPPLCLACKKESVSADGRNIFVCQNCQNEITGQKYFLCPLCNKRDPYGRLDAKCRKETGLTRFLGAPLSYKNEGVRKIIHAFKYSRVKEAANPLAQILIDFLGSSPPKTEEILVAPIPMQNYKERDRGFNQAAELAKIIALHYGLNLALKLLHKTKNTSNQADIENKAQRTQNVSGAFSCPDYASARRKIVILVDDVYTTGATMRECARVLRMGGAREVWGMAVAKG